MINITKPLINIYKKLVNLPMHKLLLLNYFLTWLGILTSLFVGKGISILLDIWNAPTINTVADIATYRFDFTVNLLNALNLPLYYAVSFSYFLNNFITAVLIIIVFYYIAKCAKNEYMFYRDSAIIYFFCVSMPLSGFIGSQLPIDALPALIPHGIFELLGVATATTIGMKLGYNIYYKKEMNFKILPFAILGIASLLFVAGLCEPMDWILYQVSSTTNQPLPSLLITFYGNVISAML